MMKYLLRGGKKGFDEWVALKKKCSWKNDNEYYGTLIIFEPKSSLRWRAF